MKVCLDYRDDALIWKTGGVGVCVVVTEKLLTGLCHS